jgi:hypothetical protein
VAPSGRGKSTLAAALALGGHRFLTDDGLLLARDEEGFSALPSHPSIGLRDDSRKALLTGRGLAGQPTHYNAKARFAAGQALPFCEGRRRLRAVFFLGGEAARPRIRPLAPRQAMTHWMRNSFLLDAEERPLLARHFDDVAHLANGVPAFGLAFRRRFEDLPEVLEAISRHLPEESR